jgi:hypothetical protein
MSGLGAPWLPSTQAFLAFHLCNFLQAGHRSGMSMSLGNDVNNIASVVSPVDTGTFRIGHLIMMSGIRATAPLSLRASRLSFQGVAPGCSGWLNIAPPQFNPSASAHASR